MKYTIRVATPESYCYIESLFEGDADGVVAEYRELTKKVHGGFGLDDKAWRTLLDKYMQGGKMTVEEGEQLSKEQSWFIKTFDNAVARQSYKNPKGNQHHSLEDNK